MSFIDTVAAALGKVFLPMTANSIAVGVAHWENAIPLIVEFEQAIQKKDWSGIRDILISAAVPVGLATLEALADGKLSSDEVKHIAEIGVATMLANETGLSTTQAKIATNIAYESRKSPI